MRQSNEIVRQVLDKMPGGAILADDPKVVYPPKEKVQESIESLIHHFHLASEGFPGSQGGSVRQHRVAQGRAGILPGQRWDEQALAVPGAAALFRQPERPVARWFKGRLISDVVAIIGSIDIVLAEIDR